MELRPNGVRRKLEAGEPAFVVGGPTHADDIDALGSVGIDGVWLEGEHGGVDAADLGNLTVWRTRGGIAVAGPTEFRDGLGWGKRRCRLGNGSCGANAGVRHLGG